jgi:hypothetical protein
MSPSVYIVYHVDLMVIGITNSLVKLWGCYITLQPFRDRVMVYYHIWGITDH